MLLGVAADAGPEFSESGRETRQVVPIGRWCEVDIAGDQAWHRELGGGASDHDVADTVAVEHLHQRKDVRELRNALPIGSFAHWGRSGRLCAIAWRASS